MIDLVIICILLTFAGTMKGLMDTMAFHDGMKDWRNKYKTARNGMLIRETQNSPWYLGLKPIGFKEKFPYSTTAFVFLTDWWHFCQFVMLRTFYTACLWTIPMSIEYRMVIIMAVMPFVFGLGFKATYR
jgi:hypothetical protein